MASPDLKAHQKKWGLSDVSAKAQLRDNLVVWPGMGGNPKSPYYPVGLTGNIPPTKAREITASYMHYKTDYQAYLHNKAVTPSVQVGVANIKPVLIAPHELRRQTGHSHPINAQHLRPNPALRQAEGEARVHVIKRPKVMR